MRGYVKASRHYHEAALVQRDGRLVAGAGYDDIVQITVKYTGARPRASSWGFLDTAFVEEAVKALDR